MNVGTVNAVFLERDIDGSIEQIIRKARQQLPFDMILLSATGTYVQAHYFMMVMFSGYIRKFFNETSPFQFGITVSLKRFSHEVLQAIVRFIYDGNVILPRVIRDEFREALQFLEIEGNCEIISAGSNECDDGDRRSSSSEDDDVMIISGTNEVIEIPSSGDEQTSDVGQELPLSGSSCTLSLSLSAGSGTP